MSALSDYFYKGPTITLNSGREINMQRIDQSLTYAHILEGTPYGPNFSGTVNLHLDWAKQKYPNRKIIVIEPRLRPLGIPEDELQKLRKPPQVDESDAFSRIAENRPAPVSIGSVCCRALFESEALSEDTWGGSELFVIWFQDGFAMPIDPVVVEQIQNIDWDNTAQDFDL